MIGAAASLIVEREATTALREWLLLFVEFLEAKQGMVQVMETLIGGPDALYNGTPARLAAPITSLVEHAVEASGVRIDVEPLDLLRAIAGVANVRHNAYSKEPAVEMVNLLLRGLGI